MKKKLEMEFNIKVLIIKLNILSHLNLHVKNIFFNIYIVKTININENLYIYASQTQHSIKYYYLIFMILLNLFDML